MRGFNHDNASVVFNIEKPVSTRHRYDYSQYGLTEERKLHINNRSGYRGVSYYARTNRWRATVIVFGNRISLGIHDTKEQAHEAVKNFDPKRFATARRMKRRKLNYAKRTVLNKNF